MYNIEATAYQLLREIDKPQPPSLALPLPTPPKVVTRQSNQILPVCPTMHVPTIYPIITIVPVS